MAGAPTAMGFLYFTAVKAAGYTAASVVLQWIRAVARGQAKHIGLGTDPHGNRTCSRRAVWRPLDSRLE